MSQDNPYQAPSVILPPALAPVGMSGLEVPFPTEPAPAISTVDTIVPRLIAANIDMVIALGLGVWAAKSVSNRMPVGQLMAFIVVYFGFYILSEGLFARTPGKLLTGLVVIPFDGGTCTWRQAVIRTLTRIFEVNPFLLGALPAGLSVLFSRHHQRIGDKLAKTVVVPTRRVRKKRLGGTTETER